MHSLLDMAYTNKYQFFQVPQGGNCFSQMRGNLTSLLTTVHAQHI